MYYSEELINEIKTHINIMDIINITPIKEKNGIVFGLCPFCKKETFVIDANKQEYACFLCQKSGDIIRYKMEHDNQSFESAVSGLARTLHMKIPNMKRTKDLKEIKKRLIQMNVFAENVFMKELSENKKGKEYVEERKLTEETIKRFELGLDNPKNNLYGMLSDTYSSDEVIASGLVSVSSKTETINKNDVYNKFYNRLIFPIRNEFNVLIGFGGRVLDDKKPKYLNSPETIVYDKSSNLYALNLAKRSKKDYFLLAEGYMDVISLHQDGFTNAVASLGTALTPMQAQKLKKYKNSVFLTYDTDGPGKNAIARAIPILKESGLETYVVDMAPYKDPDEFIKAEGKEKYAERIQMALPANEWMLKTVAETETVGIEELETMTKIIEEQFQKGR